MLLTIPNVRVLVRTVPRPTVLGNDGQEFGNRLLLGNPPEQDRDAFESARRRLMTRDWRKLRESLLNINLDDLFSVCEWLGSAGYVPRAMLAEPNAVYFTAQDFAGICSVNLGWKPDYVTQEIRQWMKGYRDVFAWLMILRDRQFREAIRMAKGFAIEEFETIQTAVHEILSKGKKPRLKDPAASFMKETGAPTDLNPRTLGLALRGTAISEVVRAELLWDYHGKPGVIAHADSPIDAICLSIHIDRNFSLRGWVRCARCGKWLDQVRGRDRFCSKKCRNYVTTTERRKKIKALAEAEQAWRAIPAQKRKGHDRWQWIAEWAKRRSKGKCEVEPSWAKQELTKMKTRQQTRDGRDDSKGGKNVTLQTR